jgi:ribosome-binding protein aMBF1 (putative translation factor)
LKGWEEESMDLEKWFQDHLDEWQSDPDYVVEGKILGFTETISEIMQKKGVNRVELANRLNVSKQFVTQFLNGTPNMTIKTMVLVSMALGSEPFIDVRRQKLTKKQ